MRRGVVAKQRDEADQYGVVLWDKVDQGEEEKHRFFSGGVWRIN